MTALQRAAAGVKFPPPYFNSRERNSPSAVITASWGFPWCAGKCPTLQLARRDQLSPGLCAGGEIQPQPRQGPAVELSATATASRCVSTKWDLALPKAPVLGDPLPVLIPSLCRGQQVTMKRGDTQQACPGLSQPRATQVTGQDSPVPCQPGALVPCAQRDSRRMRGHNGAAGVADGGARQRGPRLSAARTRVPWGDVGGAGRAEFVRWQQQLEPLPPADSVSAPRSVWG